MLGLTWQQIAAIVLGGISLMLLVFFGQGMQQLNILNKSKDAQAILAARIYVLKNLGSLDNLKKNVWILFSLAMLFAAAAIAVLFV